MPDSVSHPLRVFLCHSSGDKPAVRELYQKLNAEGWIDVWLDEEKLLPGQDWDYEIEKALDSSDAVIVSLSIGSISKEGYVQRELRFVLDLALEKPEGTIFILPVRLEECERPRRLRSIQGIDYFPPERREWAYARLRRSLEIRAQGLGITTGKPESIPEQTRQNESRAEVKPSLEEAGSVYRITTEEITNLPRVNTTSEPQAEQTQASKPPRGPTNSLNTNQGQRRNWEGVEYCLIPAGEFLMGSDQSYVDRFLKSLANISNESPRHTLSIPYDYWMMRFPVTNEQYFAFTNAVSRKHPLKDWSLKRSHPVVSISWFTARDYIKWLNNIQGSSLPKGYVFRLPTEAEWEKAARGPNSFEWPWGNEFDLSKCNSSQDNKGDTTPVGSYSPQGDSPYGCADMAGNIFEWTNSLKKGYPYNPKDGRENAEILISAISGRVTRGGSFHSDRWKTRCAVRFNYDARDFNKEIGFRLVIAPPLS
jgi:formylglycine-generating enzyme required for sulfatase activity